MTSEPQDGRAARPTDGQDLSEEGRAEPDRKPPNEEHHRSGRLRGVFADMDPVVRRRLAEQVSASLQPALDALREQLVPLQQQVVASARTAVEGIDWSAFALPPEVRKSIGAIWERHAPPNWPSDVDVEAAVDVVRFDELPLVWVPRADVVAAVLDAADRSARVQVLLAHQTQVLEDCAQVLDTIETTRAGDVLLAHQAVRALGEGHPEAAQALAAAVLESTVLAQVAKPSAVRTRVRINDIDDVEFFQLRLRLALVPLEAYFRSFTEGKTPEESRPAGPNRHLTVHAATPQHLNAVNALVSVMLLVSVLRALQDRDALQALGVDISWLTG